MNFNIIGDIAGRFDELVILLNNMPEGHVIFVGDLFDRGPKSKEVFEKAKEMVDNHKATALLGNHEHMLLHEIRDTGRYPKGVWSWNGGNATLSSFNGWIPEEVVSWIEKLPLTTRIQANECFGFNEILISHSFVHPSLSLEQAIDLAKNPTVDLDQLDDSILWNRATPCRKEFFQIAGHNSQFGVRKFKDIDGEFAICIDDSKKQRLTGLHIDENFEFSFFFQDYIF